MLFTLYFVELTVPSIDAGDEAYRRKKFDLTYNN